TGVPKPPVPTQSRPLAANVVHAQSIEPGAVATGSRNLGPRCASVVPMIPPTVADADSRRSLVTPGSDEPTDQAQAIMERVLKLVTDCRSVLRALEHFGQPGESSSAEAERDSLLHAHERESTRGS